MIKHSNFNIIADDLGLHPLVNDGIIFLLKERKIDGASLMANGSAFDDAIEKLKNVNEPGIGIHFVLVDEESLSGINLPQNHRVFFVKYILGLIKLSDIEKELRAQLDKISVAGIKPGFINSHQHLHLLPGIMDIVVKLAVEYKIFFIRTVNERVNFNGGKLFRNAQLFFLNILSSMANKKIQKAGIRHNDFFVGFINAGNSNENDIKHAQNISDKYPDKIIELGCHPGYENRDLQNKYKHWGGYNWKKELDLLSKTS